MKKIFSVLLCILMVLPCIASVSFAAGTDTEIRNVAPESATYHSSMWNSYSQSKYTIDGEVDSSYMFWRPSSSHRPGDEAVDDSLQYIGYKFNKYTQVNEVNFYAKKYGNGNNILYTVKALIMGEWVVLGTIRDNNPTRIEKESSNMGGTLAFYSVKVSTPIVTKKIQIECTEYGKTGWWDVPIITETEIMGKDGATPEYDVPEGAVLSTNAALSGLATASSSQKGYYAALANDNKIAKSSWVSKNKTDGETIQFDFDQPYLIKDVSLNFSGVNSAIGVPDGAKYQIKVEIYTGDAWKVIADGETVTVHTSLEDSYVYTFSPATASSVRVTYVSAHGNKSILSEVGATIANNKKCIFLSDYISSSKMLSMGAGNLACYGTPYADSSFLFSGISDIEYLTDGEISDTSYSWFSGSRAKNTYCGVVLNEKHSVNKVVLYFNDAIVEDLKDEVKESPKVLSFEIMAKVNDEYVKIADGTSFDVKKGKYIYSIEFDSVETDDIRIVFTSNGQVFPYCKEIEVYEKDYKYNAYSAVNTDRKTNGLEVTVENMEKSYVKRPWILDMYFPMKKR